MAINYPVNCDSSRKKTEFLYKAQEDLRLLHNIFSKWLHEGLTRKEYEGIPDILKKKYPFVDLKLSKINWDRFQKEDFTSRSNKICQEICVQRAVLKSSTAWPIDIGAI